MTVRIQLIGREKLDDTGRRLRLLSMRLEQALHGASMIEAAEVIKTSLRATAPKGKTGRLRESITWRRSPGEVRFLADAVAKYVIEGTRPHVIRPRRARALHWQQAGEDIFAMRVNHPGTKSNDFRLRAIQRAEPQLAELLHRNALRDVKEA